MIHREINTVEKEVRAVVIKEYMAEAGLDECVCLTCGNASRYLRAEGLNVEELIEPEDWYTESMIYGKWGRYGLFNATSGMLSAELMMRVAERMKEIYKEDMKWIGEMEVVCGSGETFVVMKLAFPEVVMSAVYNVDAATRWHKEAPLNGLVEALAYKVLIKQ